jgi:RNA polymerase sigma-70 factor (ECF subfamily)
VVREGKVAALKERAGEVENGVAERFGELVREHRDLVYNLGYRLLGDAAAAEDLTQEVFLRVYRGLKRFRGDSSYKTWIYRITLNTASNLRKSWARKARRRHVPLHEAPPGAGRAPDETLAEASADPERIAASSQIGRRVQAALDELPDEFREAVVLRDVEGLAYLEIAGTLQVSVGTVKSRIARGRALLRDRLADLV